jgi:hypothetical protein
MQAEADWTILIYAGGNNELEPEMRQAMLDAEKAGSSDKVNVVIQLGRAEYELVKLIRQDVVAKADDSWSGVRRYFVEKNSSVLVGDLKEANLADPQILYDFIKWGMLSYPADKYMLILGGHGYQFVGMITDYSRKAPYLMGIPEMARAIDLAANETGKKIDVLLLDTCYFNSIESIYEFGRDENHSVRSIVTHVLNVPIKGLPYDVVIKAVQKKSDAQEFISVIKEIIDNLAYDLVAFEINRPKMKHIKQLFNDAAFEYLSENSNDERNLNQRMIDDLSDIIQRIYLDMMSLIIHSKRVSQNKSQLIMAANKYIDKFELIECYNRLGFAQDNCWSSLLSNKHVYTNLIKTAQKENLLPLKMKPGEVYAYISIMNPGLEESERKDILVKLYRYKKWL